MSAFSEPPNDGIRLPRDTEAFKILNRAGGRVMPGVRRQYR
jgi:hypothetical protein